MLDATVGGPTSPLDNRQQYHDFDDENNPPAAMGIDEHEHDDDKSGSEEHRGGGRRFSGNKGGRSGGRRLGGLSSSLEASSSLLLPASRIGGVIGRGGDVIKNIRDLTGTRVHISSSSEDDRDPAVRLVTISGTVQEVCSAVELIARQAGLFGNTHRRGGSRGGDAMEEDDPYADDYYPHGLRLVIDAVNAGQLIGKKGATINEIRTNSGARVQLVSDEESAEEGALEGERVVVLTGDPEACRLAHKLICSVLAAAAANAFGGGGSSSSPGGHSHDRGGSSALPPSGLPSTSGGSSSFFSGGEALADSTFRHHQSYEGDENEEEFDNAVEVVMRIPNEKIGRVIGQGGTTINQIRTESGCRIDIENTRSGEHALRVIRITGNMAQTQAAQALIQEKVTSEALV